MPGRIVGGVKPLAMLVGSFLTTFVLLATVWLTMVGQPVAPGPTTTPPAELIVPETTRLASARPDSKPSRSPTSSPDRTIAPTDAPGSPAADASAPAGVTRTYVVGSSAFASSDVPDGATITPLNDAIALETAPGTTDALRVTYVLDAADLPLDATVLLARVKVCGEATGSTYEIDGPSGASESIIVSQPPEGDGCWHLSSTSPTQLSVSVSATDGTRVVVRSVEYTVTFAR